MVVLLAILRFLCTHIAKSPVAVIVKMACFVMGVVSLYINASCPIMNFRAMLALFSCLWAFRGDLAKNIPSKVTVTSVFSKKVSIYVEYKTRTKFASFFYKKIIIKGKVILVID